MERIRFLLNLGFLPTRTGWEFWIAFIENKLYNLPACTVYEKIGKMFNKTAAVVEHAMRTELTNAFNSGKLQRLNIVFDTDVVSTAPLSNSEMMHLLKFVDQYDLFGTELI